MRVPDHYPTNWIGAQWPSGPAAESPMARLPAVLGRLNGALLVFIKKCTFASDMEFEWDPEKAKANEQKHHLSFHEGADCLWGSASN